MQTIHNSYLDMLEQWYTAERWDEAHNILTGKNGISLRMYEFVTKRYAPKVSYVIEDADGCQRTFDLHLAIVNAQRIKKKKFLDAFARANKDLENNGIIQFGAKYNKVVSTSVAQLMYLRFLISNGVTRYVEDNIDMLREKKALYEDQRRMKIQQRKRRRTEEAEQHKEDIGNDLREAREYISRRAKRKKRFYRQNTMIVAIRD